MEKQLKILWGMYQKDRAKLTPETRWLLRSLIKKTVFRIRCVRTLEMAKDL